MLQRGLPVEGFVELDIPVERLWEVFVDVERWPEWNRCFWRARVSSGKLSVGATLTWFFNPIRPFYLYKMPAEARIVEYEPHRRVTWEVTVLPGFHARHSYLFEDLGSGRTRFGSWEVARGPLFRLVRPFWLAHFRYVCRSSLEGARALAGHMRGGIRFLRLGRTTSARPLLAVPGLDGSPGTIAPIVDQLSRGRLVVVADFSGERNATYEGLAAEIGAGAREELPGPFDILGESLGSFVAARLSADGSLPVQRVVLTGTFTRLDPRRLRLTVLMGRFTPRPLYRILTPLLMAWVCGPVGDGKDHPFFDYIRDSDPKAAIKRTKWEIDRDFGVELHKVTGPTLVVMGRNDRMVPDISREVGTLRALFSDRPARVVLIPKAGHVLLPAAAISEAVAEIRGFLDDDHADPVLAAGQGGDGPATRSTGPRGLRGP